MPAKHDNWGDIRLVIKKNEQGNVPRFVNLDERNDDT